MCLKDTESEVRKMKEVFYTEEQKEVLGKEIQTNKANGIPMTQSVGLMILDVLGEQQNTLQNIECILQRMEKVIFSEEQSQ